MFVSTGMDRWRGLATVAAGTLALVAAAGLWRQPIAAQAPVPPTLAAPPAALPPAADLVARHVAAIGGEQAFHAIRSILARGRWEIPARRIAGTIELRSARPAKMLYRVTVPGIGRIESGYNGRVGWSLSPITGPEVLSGRQLAEAADEAWFDGTLHAPDRVREMATVGLETFDGRPAYRVRVILRSGTEQFEFFDVATGLQIGIEAVRATPQGNVPTVNVLRDYKAFGDVLHATTLIQRALGFEQVVTITSCEYVDLPADSFDLPAEIQALLPR